MTLKFTDKRTTHFSLSKSTLGASEAMLLSFYLSHCILFSHTVHLHLLLILLKLGAYKAWAPSIYTSSLSQLIASHASKYSNIFTDIIQNISLLILFISLCINNVLLNIIGCRCHTTFTDLTIFNSPVVYVFSLELNCSLISPSPLLC